jgi:hypothetical protein
MLNKVVPIGSVTSRRQAVFPLCRAVLAAQATLFAAASDVYKIA